MHTWNVILPGIDSIKSVASNLIESIRITNLTPHHTHIIYDICARGTENHRQSFSCHLENGMGKTKEVNNRIANKKTEKVGVATFAPVFWNSFHYRTKKEVLYA